MDERMDQMKEQMVCLHRLCTMKKPLRETREAFLLLRRALLHRHFLANVELGHRQLVNAGW
jgi:hypothetical protein